MTRPLEGVRVVEMGLWVAGPAAGGILADWGADVIKVEPPGGDPFRRLFASLAGLKASGRPDLALVVNDGPSRAAAAVFTSNRVEAAPVTWKLPVALSPSFTLWLRPRNSRPATGAV